MGIRIAQVMKAKSVRKGDVVMVASDDSLSIDWRVVTDCDQDYDGSIDIRVGEGWDNQQSFDPRARLVVMR